MWEGKLYKNLDVVYTQQASGKVWTVVQQTFCFVSGSTHGFAPVATPKPFYFVPPQFQNFAEIVKCKHQCKT